MSRTPAGHLAGLKTKFPAWTIAREEGGYVAVCGVIVIHRAGLPALEAALIEAADIRMRRTRKADQVAEQAMDVIDKAVAEGKLPG